MADPVPGLAMALCLAALFAAAAFGKLADLAAFRAVLAGYRLVPQPLLVSLAAAIPAVEAALAVAWLAPALRPDAAVLSSVLLGVYAAAVAVNLWRGRAGISCGCSFGGGDRLSWWLVARNGVLVLAAVLAGVTPSDRALGAFDYAVAAAIATAAALLYLAAQQLIGNATTVRVMPSWEP